ncbi:hypothetical protein ACW9HR_27240 [Nocardia gipuzkoensis]
MTLTREDLAGYIERDLDADLERWFPGGPAVAVPEETRPVTPFLERLAPADAAALAAFDRRVRSGRMPQFLDIYSWSYGFDFAANDCGIRDSDYETELTDDDVYSIGADGGGNLYVVRYQAVRAGVLQRAAVEADFLSLGQDGALEPELGLLRSMK